MRRMLRHKSVFVHLFKDTNYLALGLGTPISFLGLEPELIYCFWRTGGGAIITMGLDCGSSNLERVLQVLRKCLVWLLSALFPRWILILLISDKLARLDGNMYLQGE